VVPNLLQQVDRLFDPTMYDQTGMAGALLKSQVPFVRRENKPALNVLGDPVKSGPFHYWASAEHRIRCGECLPRSRRFIPEPSKTTIIGSKKLDPDHARAITPDEYYELIATSGPQIRAELLNQLDGIKSMKDDEAQALVSKIANTFHTAAKANLQ
jgi:hypothetical protein